MDKKFTKQYGEWYDDLDNFKNGKARTVSFQYQAKLISLNELLAVQRLFIVAEPGYGKTTLLNQIVLDFEQRGVKYKHATGLDPQTLDLDSDTEYVIFDALDESKDVLPTFLHLLALCEDKDVKIIISNRLHYIGMIQHLLQAKDFQFLKLLAFDEYQIKSYLNDHLSKLNYTSDQIDQIIINSKGTAVKSILRTPRYLNEFCKYIIKDNISPGQITRLSKSDLFEKVFYYKLEHDGSQSKNSKYLTKRVLERLALVMEIHGLNQIHMEDFVTFLDQTNSNISLIFLNSIDLEDLLSRVMKLTDQNLQFEHTEFQEYLAAKELSRMGYRFQTVYDLMVDQKLQLLRTNWIDVLTFAVEIQPEFSRPLLSFIQNNRGTIDEKLVELLVEIPASHFDDFFRDQFFDVILNYYSSRGKIIYHTYTQLADYITNQRTDVLTPTFAIAELKDSVVHMQNNQILLIEALAEKNKLSKADRSLWISYLFNLAQEDEFHSMQVTIFRAMVALEDKESVLRLIPIFEQKPDYILNNLFFALSRLAPNDILTSQLITRCLSAGNRVDRLDSLINRITDENRIIDFFKSLSGSISILESDRFRFGAGFHGLFQHIETLNSKKINKVVYLFVCNVFQYRRYIHQMVSIVELSFKHSLKCQRGFLKKIMTFPTFLQSVDIITEVLAWDLDLKTFKKIESYILSGSESWRLNRVVHKIKFKLEKIEDHELYLYINKKYLIPWSQNSTPDETQKTKTPIQEIRDLYLEDQSFFHPALVPKFVERFEEIQQELQDSDTVYLREIVEIVLRNYNPDNFKIEIIGVKSNQTSFTHNHEIWFHIELYFKAAYLLFDWDLLKKYKVEFIKTMPRFDIFEHKKADMVTQIINVIGGLDKHDEDLLYTFCLEREDDLLALSGRSFAEIAAKLKMDALKPILLKLIKSPKVKMWDQQEILKAFGELAKTDQDKKDLKSIFRYTKHIELKSIANGYLVSVFEEPAAILWRFEALKSRCEPFDMEIKYNGARSVSDFETEMDRPEFPKCLYSVHNQLVRDKMLDLLNYSFLIRSSKTFVKYSIYLQSIIYTYFQPIIKDELISSLRKVANSFPTIEQTYSFNQTLDKLVEELHLKIRNEEPFSTSVHSANEILSKTYLPIQSDHELKELILKIFANEIKILIEDDGLYRLSDQFVDIQNALAPNITEAIIQKTLKIALGKALIENGLRKSDIHREVESMDGKKYDYLISYGLFGPVMVELKLMHNDEIIKPGKRKAYKKKLSQYLRANGGMGIYAIFQVRDNKADWQNYEKMVADYKDIPGLDIINMQCFRKSID